MNEFFVLIAFCFLIGFVYLHEAAHQASFTYFGVPSRISFDLSGGHAIADANVSIEQKNFVALAASINESIGYQLMPFVLALLVVSILQMRLLIEILNKGDKKHGVESGTLLEGKALPKLQNGD